MCSSSLVVYRDLAVLRGSDLSCWLARCHTALKCGPANNNAPMNKDRWNYKHFASLQFPGTPSKRDKECVYSVAFNVLDPKYYLYFAAVLNNRVSISSGSWVEIVNIGCIGWNIFGYR